MKKILSRLMMGITLATAAGLSFASEDPLLGKWKTIDDQSGYSRADVEIRKKPDGSYEGITVETRSLPGAEKLGICSKGPGQLKNKPFIGLPFIWDFKADPKKPREFTTTSLSCRPSSLSVTFMVQLALTVRVPVTVW